MFQRWVINSSSAAAIFAADNEIVPSTLDPWPCNVTVLLLERLHSYLYRFSICLFSVSIHFLPTAFSFLWWNYDDDNDNGAFSQHRSCRYPVTKVLNILLMSRPHPSHPPQHVSVSSKCQVEAFYCYMTPSLLLSWSRNHRRRLLVFHLDCDANPAGKKKKKSRTDVFLSSFSEQNNVNTHTHRRTQQWVGDGK